MSDSVSSSITFLHKVPVLEGTTEECANWEVDEVTSTMITGRLECMENHQSIFEGVLYALQEEEHEECEENIGITARISLHFFWKTTWPSSLFVAGYSWET